MYVTATLSENTVLAYSDPHELSDTPSLHGYYCEECGLEFVSHDPERCPVCLSDEIRRTH